MLPPDSRSLLIDELRPPAGMTLSRAVAMTYTLDFESLLAAPLAFAAHNLRDSVDPIAAMEAVRRSADRIDVFCQSGRAAVPPDTGLVAFVEKVVHPVRRPRPGHIFHPKLWAVRFHDPDRGDASLRLLVLSRNLTTDRSWDMCLRLDGVIGSRPLAGNRPLFDLISYTAGLTVDPLPDDRAAGIAGLAEDFRRAEWELPDGATSITFYPLGLPRAVRPDFTGTRHLVISPFCTPGGLQRCAPGGNATVISRQDTFDLLPPESVDDDRAWVINELAGIPADDTVAGRDIQSGLHAKIFVIEQGWNARVLLGSANATDAAFNGNVELLVELTGARKQFGVDAMTGPEAPFRGILEPYFRRDPGEPDPDSLALDDLLYDLAALPLTGTVHGGPETFGLDLDSIATLPAADGIRLTARLYTRAGDARDLTPGQPVRASFDGLDLADITPFIVLTAAAGSGRKAQTVVIARLIGDPLHRLDHILAGQIDTPEKFLRLLFLLLGLGIEPSTADVANGGGDSGTWLTAGRGILETLLTTLADRPQQLDDLARVIAGFESTEHGRALLPPGFSELWRVLDEARRTEEVIAA